MENNKRPTQAKMALECMREHGTSLLWKQSKS